MEYRTVLFAVPVREEAEEDISEWVRRELALESLLVVLHTASRPAAPEPPESA